MTTANSRAHDVLRIAGEMTIYRAGELKQTLCAALERAELLEVDLAAVTELDSAGVQVLMLAKKQALAQRRTLRLSAHSPAVLEVFELLNLGAHFGDPLVISARRAAGAAEPNASKEARA